jgi:hypothetical protein
MREIRGEAQCGIEDKGEAYDGKESFGWRERINSFLRMDASTITPNYHITSENMFNKQP